MKRTFGVLAAVILVTSTACSEEVDVPDATDDTVDEAADDVAPLPTADDVPDSGPLETEAPPETAAPTETEAPPETTAGGSEPEIGPDEQVIAVEDPPVSFAIPEDWVVLDEETVDEVMSSPEFEDGLAGTGFDADALRQMLSTSIEFFVADLTPSTPGFVDNINALVIPSAVATPQQVETELGAIGATIESTREAVSESGASMTITEYELTVPGSSVSGAYVVVDAGAESVVATVSTSDPSVRATIVERIVATATVG